MAVTFTPTFGTLGPYRMAYGTLSNGGASVSGAVSSGLEWIAGGMVTPASIDTTADAKFKWNLEAAGTTAAFGSIYIKGGKAGDDYYVVVFGR